MKIYSETKIYEGLGYTPENVEEIERRAREEGTTAGATDGYNDGYESGRTDYETYKAEYFTVEALSAGTLNVYHNTEYTQSGTLFCKINDDENWTPIPIQTSAYPNYYSINLSAGDKVYFKGTLERSNRLFGGSDYTLLMNVYGNIQSLYFDDDFSGETACKEANHMFWGNKSLVNASNLVLPATTLLTRYYMQMFADCTNLIAAPALPATTLAYECYSGMFINCTSLTTAPELPATTLAGGCYYHMFMGCTNLTTAPELPATTLANTCYRQMFQNCTSLTEAPALPATTITQNCYYGMFQGCSSLTTAPELPATTLVASCYQTMFQGCTSLNSITCLATKISAYACTTNWVSGVSSTGTFTKAASMTGWTTGNNGIPNGWTVIDAE